MCRVLVLEDNDLLHLARGAYTIYNLQRDNPSAKVASVSRAMSRLDMEVSAADPFCYSNAELKYPFGSTWRCLRACLDVPRRRLA